MDMLTLKDRIERGDYRSDRFAAVPFVTFADMLKQPAEADQPNYPECGAFLIIGSVQHVCHQRLGHAFLSGQNHDWAALLENR